MNKQQTKREREKQVVTLMIQQYCKKKHVTQALCPEFSAHLNYSFSRIMESKTFCSNCRVHCYKPDMREKIRQVMRFSGPLMIFYHPVLAIRHVIESRREKKKLEKRHEI